MSTLTGARDSSYWHPAMTGNTNTSSYWLNWRALLCGVWVVIAIVLAWKPILKYEGLGKKVEEGEEEEERVGSLYEDETWMTCLKGLHPAWLLSFRVFAFFVLLVTLVFTSIVDDPTIYYFYTQWTFMLVTIYFGLGSLLSVHGCYKYYKRSSGDKVDNVEVDTEQGNNVIPDGASKGCNNALKRPETDDRCVRQPAGVWGYAFQIMFQMNAGAVLLTDCVFWCIIVPFLEINDYSLNALDINLHTINVVFLLGDTALNCLRFPCFRIAYFFLWTVAYVIFQWILHASVKLWWPYPFLDLSSSYAPLWYFTVAVLHVPCYGGYALVIKLKHHLLRRWFADSYRCAA